MPEWKPEILRRLAPLKLAPTREAEITDELSQHLNDLYQELLAAGHPADSAFRAALDELKGDDFLARSVRPVEKDLFREPVALEKTSSNFFDGILQDVRYALRMLRKSPGFTAVAVLTLALGIGANTSIFNLVNAFFLRPLPGVTSPGKLARLAATADGSDIAVSYPEYQYYKENNRVFAHLAAYRNVDFQLGSGGEPQRLQGAAVSSDYFAVLGARFALGRWFLPEENEAPGAFPVAAISYKVWSERFHADPGLLGKSVILNGHPFIVVGVAAKGFQGIDAGEASDIWAPLAMYGEAMPEVVASYDDVRIRWLSLIGRLKPGVNRNQAQADMRQLSQQFSRAHLQGHESALISVVPQFGFEIDSFEAILFATVGFLLLVACANVANLLLVQSSMRKGEFAIRQALGATRERLARQLLVEGVVLSLLGGAAALVATLWVPQLLLPFLNSGGPAIIVDLQPDIRVFGFALVISVLSGIAFTLAPATQVWKRDLIPDLKDTAVGITFKKSGLRNALVIVQISLSIVLLIGADLLLTALGRIDAVKPDFETKNVLLVSIQPGMQGYNQRQLTEFYRQLQRRVESLPGVRATGLATDVLAGGFFSEEIAVEGHELPPSEPWTAMHYDSISPGYFGSMGVPLLRGREFEWGDTAGAPNVLILNESASRKLFGMEDPVGRMVHLKSEKNPREIVGMVKDAWDPGLWESPPANIYFPLLQDHPWWTAAVVIDVWTKGDAKAELPAVERAVQSVDMSLPVYDVRTMTEYLQQALWTLRTANALTGVVGLLALLMAMVGVYGVISYAVSQRTHEIGVRMALGAQPRDVLCMVIGEGLVLMGEGIAGGVLSALALTRFLRTMLFGVTPTDFTTFAAVCALLVSIALFACYIPARRAMKVDPMVALRYE